MNNYLKTLAWLAVLSLNVVTSTAAVIVTPLTDSTFGTYTAESTDLVQSGSSTLSSVAADATVDYGDLLNLNDGAIGSFGSLSTITAWESEPVTLTFNLNTTINTLGYDLTSVRSIAAWGGVRAHQNYSLYVKTVGSGSFSLLGSGSTGSASVTTSLLTFTDSTGVLASGVDAVRFVITNSGSPNVGSAFLEFDVLGVAAVPEVSSVWLVLMGCLAVVFIPKNALRSGV